MVTTIFKHIKQFFLNQYCYSCLSKNTESYSHICPKCVDKLLLVRSINNICPFCHDTWFQNNICQNCSNKIPLWSNLHTIFSLKDTTVKQIFYLYKFKNSILAEKDLIKLLTPYLSVFQEYYFIIIPCSQKTLQRLGCNPVTRIIKQLNLEYSECLYKQTNNIMKHLDRQHRLTNTQVFRLEIENIPKNKKIMLIDDVLTTGTTLNNASQVLYNNGIVSFETLCLFRS